ncbi:hypothetical protein [Paenibacillus gansuensis]|uniref:Uncharacterized protein n=1 Tax=Paenibacillus gansuensis TaxID=306542 RepID=A0ABW5PJC2_9BACL
MGALGKRAIGEAERMVRVEMELSSSNIRKLIAQLHGKDPLVSELKNHLMKSVELDSSGEQQSTAVGKLTYLTERLNVTSTEGLLSKALSFVNMGLQLEDRGYEILAVRKSLLSKEVIKFNLQGG